MKNTGYCVKATDIEIWAAIGVHKEEEFIATRFNISVSIEAKDAYMENNYINYEFIADAVAMVFKRPQTILENICVEIINEIKAGIIAPVASIECEIKKFSPSIDRMKIGAFVVKIVKTY